MLFYEYAALRAPAGDAERAPRVQPRIGLARGMRVGEDDHAKRFPSSLWLRVEG
jgi:hypothetical protein